MEKAALNQKPESKIDRLWSMRDERTPEWDLSAHTSAPDACLVLSP
jgi:hypothetical protein